MNIEYNPINWDDLQCILGMAFTMLFFMASICILAILGIIPTK